MTEVGFKPTFNVLTELQQSENVDGGVVVPETITDPDTAPDTDPVPETADTRTDEDPCEENPDEGVTIPETNTVPNTVPDTVPENIETALSVTGTTLREHTGTTNTVSGTDQTGTSTSPNISVPSDIIAPSLSTASMPLPTTDDQPDLVIIIEGDSDPIIKTEALQPVEEISISPATLEQINLEVTKDKSSGCGTVEVANESW